jgi:uncharacterized integral membrane protein (TIGR00698 family)
MMSLNKIVFPILGVVCLLPVVSAPIALLLGVAISQFSIDTFPAIRGRLTPILLQASVVGLGFGMNVFQALETGRKELFLTLATISLTVTLGLLLGKRLKIDKYTSLLIASGTAICGGSAIAAVSSVVKAGHKQIATALGTVFILNALALFVFPWIGHQLHLTQQQFGTWAAVAIHDTSSVVGAAGYYGNEALSIATAIKLERALWIIPFMFIISFFYQGDTSKAHFPYFILLFVVAMVINTFVPTIQPVASFIVILAKLSLKLTLFLVGAGLSRQLVREVGLKPFVQGVMLWILISVVSLTYIYFVVK